MLNSPVSALTGGYFMIKFKQLPQCTDSGGYFMLNSSFSALTVVGTLC